MNSSRQYRTSRSLSPPKGKDASREQDDHTCDRCHKKKGAEDKKANMTDKSQQTRMTHEKTQDHQQWRYAANGRRPSSRQACLPADGASRNTRQANMMCTKHEKEKAKMQATIEKLQEAFCDKESKLQDTKSQLVRERRMAEIMERQLKNARNLSEQLGRIIHDREQEIRTLKNLLNKRQDSSRNPQETAAVIRANRQAERRRSTSKDDFQASMRRSSSTSDHTECPSLSSTSVDKMLKEVHSLIDGLKIKDEAIKGLQEECTRRLDKIQILQRSIQMLQDQITQNTQHHNTVSLEKDNMITQLQHSLKESEDTVQSLLSEKTKVVIEGENTIQELQDIIQQKDVMIKRIQNQLEEALESKENELLQLRDALESRQRDLEAKQRDLEEAHEELFRSQMEGEALKMELNQEKCSLNKMSEEINSLVEKLTMAVQEMELTKQEYHKKEEKLKHTQSKMQEMCVMLLGDQDIIEKLQSLYQARRQLTGRKVLSEEDVIERILHSSPRNFYDLNERSMSKMGSLGLSNQQIHKQQLAELQQQVNDSQAVCSILQDQLKEVTDFLDQLLHIDISPKNLPALSLIRHYGKHLKSPSNVLSKERVAPDGVSSNSQLDIEFSRQTSNEVEDQLNESNGNDDEASNFVIEAHHASIENMSFYGQAARNFYINQRSASAGDRLDTTTQSITSTQEMNENDFKEAPISVSVQGASSESDEIILLLNDHEANQATSSDANRKSRKLSRPQVSSPPFPRGLKITENYGSDGSINTRENSSNVIERSVSFGSFSDSVLMSYEQSERGASDESSGMVNNRCVRSIDMLDLIPVGNNEVKPGVFLSSDSDIWSEPDTSLSRRRMGLYVEETPDSSEHSSTYVSDDLQKKKLTLPSRCESRKSRNIIHVPTKKTANKVRRWLEKLKNYLRMFEEANFHLTDEINNLCDVRNQMLALLSTEDRVDNSDAILQDLAEYIRLNFLMQKKLEKSIHFNRQLIDVFQRNISCQRKSTLDSPPVKPNPPRHPSRQKKNHVPKRTSSHCEDNPVVSDPTKPYESANIHSQLVGYHATLMSCQDMIKDLHSQLKDRHCNEIINKQELNRTVYNYLEDIDHCIDDLCKKMETTSDNSPNQNYAFNQVFGNGVLPDEETEDIAYENTETYSSPLMEKLKENEERLLRFEVLLNDKEQQLKMSAENALQLEEQLNSIKQSLYEIQMENLELKECLELSENKQLEMEDSSNQMLRELQMTMQRLSDLEERFRCLNDEQFVQKELDKSLYPMQYNYQNGSTWEDEAGSENIPSRERANSTYSRNWESENY